MVRVDAARRGRPLREDCAGDGVSYGELAKGSRVEGKVEVGVGRIVRPYPISTARKDFFDGEAGVCVKAMVLAAGKGTRLFPYGCDPEAPGSGRGQTDNAAHLQASGGDGGEGGPRQRPLSGRRILGRYGEEARLG